MCCADFLMHQTHMSLLLLIHNVINPNDLNILFMDVVLNNVALVTSANAGHINGEDNELRVDTRTHSETGFLIGVSRSGSLVGASETFPLEATPSGCCCRDRLAGNSTNGSARNGSLECLRCLRFLLYIWASSVRT